MKRRKACTVTHEEQRSSKKRKSCLYISNSPIFGKDIKNSVTIYIDLPLGTFLQKLSMFPVVGKDIKDSTDNILGFQTFRPRRTVEQEVNPVLQCFYFLLGLTLYK